jgi:hypothetical protein
MTWTITMARWDGKVFLAKHRVDDADVMVSHLQFFVCQGQLALQNV